MLSFPTSHFVDCARSEWSRAGYTDQLQLQYLTNCTPVCLLLSGLVYSNAPCSDTTAMKTTYATQYQTLCHQFSATGSGHLASSSSISLFPVTTSISLILIAKEVKAVFPFQLAQPLCPKYSTRKIGRVMYAARKFAALQFAGKNTWKPFVKVRIIRIASAAYEAYGWNGVA